MLHYTNVAQREQSKNKCYTSLFKYYINGHVTFVMFKAYIFFLFFFFFHKKSYILFWAVFKVQKYNGCGPTGQKSIHTHTRNKCHIFAKSYVLFLISRQIPQELYIHERLKFLFFFPTKKYIQ